MENASKALIIAGAILISILLISVGIIIMNAINEPVQQGANAADSQAIEIFNSKFTSYAGTQKGTTIRQLITSVNSSNASSSEDQQITLTINNDDSLGVSNIVTSESYFVEIGYSGETGYIDTINVTGTIVRVNGNDG